MMSFSLIVLFLVYQQIILFLCKSISEHILIKPASKDNSELQELSLRCSFKNVLDKDGREEEETTHSDKNNDSRL